MISRHQHIQTSSENHFKVMSRIWSWLMVTLLVVICFAPLATQAQNNVGIGTDTIPPSAILQVADSTRGILIPRVNDTTEINNYVNTLFPNPGITDGLMVYSVSDHKFYYYNGILSRWVASNNIIGPIGPTGPTGLIGPTGNTGVSTDWRTDFIDDPVFSAW